MNGIVELAALCVVIVVGVPLACLALYMAGAVVYGVVLFAYYFLLTCMYTAAAPFWLTWRLVVWVVKSAFSLARRLAS